MLLMKNLNKQNKVILLGIIGFFVTGILLYPYGTFWDSARALTYILIDGHANVDNWLGWYFPLLWEGLYRLTDIPNIFGTYIVLLYWIGVTLLYLNIFNLEKRSLWWYVAFAWFPGSLMFVVNITNNALMMVMLILGLAFFALYANKKKWFWLVLSILTIFQCAFIRRESFVIIVPLVFVILLIAYLRYQSKWRAAVYSFITGVILIVGVFGAEKAITKKLPNYDYMDALSITSIHDMSAVTYMTGKMCIPSDIFKDEYSDGKACFEDIMSMEHGRDSIYNGDIMFHHVGPYMQLEDRYMLHMPKEDIIKFYSKNVVSWLKFRVRYIFHYFWDKQQMCYSTLQDNDKILYSPESPTIIQIALSYAVPALFGTLQVFYYLSFIVLLLDWRKRIAYRSRQERLFIYSLIGVALIETALVLFTSIAIQYRYLYPVCVLQYLVFIYVLSRLKYKEIGAKFSAYEV